MNAQQEVSPYADVAAETKPLVEKADPETKHDETTEEVQVEGSKVEATEGYSEKEDAVVEEAAAPGYEQEEVSATQAGVEPEAAKVDEATTEETFTADTPEDCSGAAGAGEEDPISSEE